MHEVLNNCPTPPDFYYPSVAHDQKDSADLYVSLCFIEDDKNWSVVIYGDCYKSVGNAEVPGWDSDDPAGFEIWCVGPQVDTYYFLTTVFSCVNGHLSSEQFPQKGYFTHYAPEWGIFDAKDETFGSFIPNTTFYLQDGFHYQSEEYIYYYTWDNGEHLVTEQSVLMKITMFTPTGNEIFSGLIDPNVRFIILNKFKGGFLFGVNRTQSYRYSTLDYVDSFIGFSGGLFFLPSNKNGNELSSWEILSTFDCLNQRFRPMQHYKNWPKRIQKISLK